MLVLLIIFMVAAPLATVDIAVNLPASTAEPKPRPDQPLFLSVKSDLTIALGDQTIRASGSAASSTRPPKATRTRSSSCARTRAFPTGK
jgi:biopolymer transport protein ExbD